jgi:hypothetical protein
MDNSAAWATVTRLAKSEKSVRQAQIVENEEASDIRSPELNGLRRVFDTTNHAFRYGFAVSSSDKPGLI